MMKQAYDLAKRHVRPKTFIQEVLDEDIKAARSEDERAEHQVEADTARAAELAGHSDLGKDPRFHEWRKDAVGREWAYDVFREPNIPKAS